jgi:hypothetical protein
MMRPQIPWKNLPFNLESNSSIN